MIPLATIELALRLAILILEGIPPEQRRASAMLWWEMWWPLLKETIPEAKRKQIEETMEKK
jgi:hypothetical protein